MRHQHYLVNDTRPREYFRNSKRGAKRIWKHKTLCGAWVTENGYTAMPGRVTCPKCAAKLEGDNHP